jgi:phage-related baseplate assembly protein
MFDPVAEAERVLAACNIKVRTWREKVLAEQQRLGRALTLNELLKLAECYEITPEEINAQRQSWAQQMID